MHVSRFTFRENEKKGGEREREERILDEVFFFFISFTFQRKGAT